MIGYAGYQSDLMPICVGPLLIFLLICEVL